MSAVEVKVPDIGDFKDIPVIEVFVKPGDTVKPEDSLVTLESDKATMDVPSPAAGVVKELKVKLGDKVSEGSVILVLDSAASVATTGEAKPAVPAAAATAATPAKPAPARAAPRGLPRWPRARTSGECPGRSTRWACWLPPARRWRNCRARRRE